MAVLISKDTLDTQKIISMVQDPLAGGTDIFIGTVRSETDYKKVTSLFFEAYAPMAEREMQKLINQASINWPIIKAVIHHRVGHLKVGDVAVVIAVSAAHRKAAFEACRYILDALKETVPIWKKEIFEDGQVWVSAHP